MKKSKNINSKDDLLNEIEIENIEEIEKNDEALKKFVKLTPQISPDLVKEILVSFPKLIIAFNEVIKNMAAIGKSLEETKRKRWEFLKEVSKTGRLNGDQILEAMKIITEIEKYEKIDWNIILNKVLKVLGIIIIALLSAIGGAAFVGRNTDS